MESQIPGADCVPFEKPELGIVHRPAQVAVAEAVAYLEYAAGTLREEPLHPQLRRRGEPEGQRVASRRKELGTKYLDGRLGDEIGAETGGIHLRIPVIGEV